jgi:hypothetical protein
MPQFVHVAPTIVTSGTTWTALKTGGLKVLLDNLSAANTAKANPTTQVTAAGSVSAGGLLAGTYYFAYTFCDAFGETTIGTGESAQFTSTGAAQLCTLTLPALPTGCQSINVYSTRPGGASGSETLYATGITGTTLAMTFALPSDQPSAIAGGPPANSTGAAVHASRLYAAIVGANTELKLSVISQTMSDQLSGVGMELREWFGKPYMIEGIVKCWLQIMSEYNTLLAANAPTAGVTIQQGAGMPTYNWTLP